MQISSMNSYNQFANSMNGYNQLSTSLGKFFSFGTCPNLRPCDVRCLSRSKINFQEQVHPLTLALAASHPDFPHAVEDRTAIWDILVTRGPTVRTILDFDKCN